MPKCDAGAQRSGQDGVAAKAASPWDVACRIFAACVAGAALLAPLPLLPTPLLADAKPAREGQAVRVGGMTFDKGKPALCFAEHFLSDVARRTGANVERKLVELTPQSRELFGLPMVIMTGDDSFQWNDAQAANVRAYLQRGGLILGSATCSSENWSASFKAAIAKALAAQGEPAPAWRVLPMDHAIFRTLHRIEKLRTKQGSVDPVVIEGLEVGGRLAVVFSAVGLNDTGATGGRCCCCGLDEMQDADRINANILAYTLTR